MRWSSYNFSLFVLSLISKQITSVLSAVSEEFAVVGDFFVNRTGMTLSYNYTQLPFVFSQCHEVLGNFSMDYRGHDHAGVAPQVLDFFTWGVDQLNVIFQTAVDWPRMTTQCFLDTVGEYANHSFACNSTNFGRAVFYHPYPHRLGLVGFSNANASLVVCESPTNGFIVAGYQPDWLSLVPAEINNNSTNSTAPFSDLVTEVSTWDPALWAAVAVGSVITLLLILNAKAIGTSAVNTYRRLRGEERIGLFEERDDPRRGSINYGSTDDARRDDTDTPYSFV